MRRIALALFAIASSALLPSCAIVDELLAEQAVDSTELSQNEAALFLSVVEDLLGTMSEEQMAATAAAQSNLRFPGGCVQATAAGTKVTYVLTQCSGRYGLSRVNGTMEVTFLKVAGGLQVHLVTANLKINRSVLKIDSTATITWSGAAASLAVTSLCEGTGPRGNTVVVSGAYEVTFDTASECLDLQGDWSAQVEQKTWTLSITDFARCANTCPKSGGKIAFQGGIKGVTVQVEFPGTDQAPWSSSRGSSGVLQLECGN